MILAYQIWKAIRSEGAGKSSSLTEKAGVAAL